VASLNDPVQVEVKGLAELKEALLQLSPRLQAKGLRGANFAGAEVLVTAAKQTTAFKDVTGALRAGIGAFKRPSPLGSAKHAVGVKGEIRTYLNTSFNRRKGRVGKRYHAASKLSTIGRFLEFGTSRMPAHPWLRPALFQSVQKMVDAIRTSLEGSIAKYTKK
jgi:HK97 gp10 family phage protein